MWNLDDINEDDFIHSLDDGNTEFVSPEEVYPEVTQRVAMMQSIQIPRQFEQQNTKESQNSEIPRLLKNLPGILPPVECFSKSYVPPKPETQPSIILDDRIPIFLGKEYFKFDRDPEQEGVNDQNKNSGASSIDSNHNGCLGEPDINRNSGENDMQQRKLTIADYRRQFWTVFGDSDDESNATPVKEPKDCKIVDNSVIPKEIKRRYYTPLEIYMMKRGNKNKQKFQSGEIIPGTLSPVESFQKSYFTREPEEVDDENNN